MRPPDLGRREVKALQSAVLQLEREHPEISAVAFGSLVRNEAHPKSDLDFEIFVDPSKINRIDNSRLWENARRVSEREGYCTFDALGPHRETVFEFPTYSGIVKHYEQLVAKRCKVELEEVSRRDRSEPLRRAWTLPDLKKGMMIVPISSEIINRYIDAGLRFLLSVLDEEGKNPAAPYAALASLFRLGIGSNIRVYREHLLRSLIQRGPEGAELWTGIADHVIHADSPSRFKPRRGDFPRTLEGAIKRYAPHLARHSDDAG